MWEEDIPLCFTTECKYNDYGDCTIDPADCPYLQDQELRGKDKHEKNDSEHLKEVRQ